MGERSRIVEGEEGRKIVLIPDIIFKGRRDIPWKEVEVYLKRYTGFQIKVLEYWDVIHIASDFHDEYTGSKYTARLKGTAAKAKANAVLGLLKIIEIAGQRRYQENLADKHNENAKYGWYRYDSYFALPVLDEGGKLERYNQFCGELVVRIAADGKLYLYDMINIKKETSTPPGQMPYG